MNARRRLFVLAVLCPCLALGLSSCATSPAVRTETVKVPVPVLTPLDPALLMVTPLPPVPQSMTNEQLLGWAYQCAAVNWTNSDKLVRIKALQPKSQ